MIHKKHVTARQAQASHSRREALTVTGYRSGGRNFPAINVKYQHRIEAEPHLETKLDLRPNAADIRQATYDLAQKIWWEDAAGIASDIFGDQIEIFAEGRSGGWLLVKGLGAPESWDKKMLKLWKFFEKKILEMLKPNELNLRYSSAVSDMLTIN